jgi:pyrroloquinoline-quinone synthase
MESDRFVRLLDGMIYERRKMTSPLYQTILAGRATERLLQNFCIHRYPIKNVWTQNLMGVGSRLPDYELRVELVRNLYEEETGALTGGGRHLQTFLDFGEAVGVPKDVVVNAPLMTETRRLCDHNVNACCNTNVHFTEGVASVLLLMEGQPPIVDRAGKSMLSVMRDVYGLPPKGYEFFVHHASSDTGSQAVSDLEDEHADVMREILRRYCDTEDLQQRAIASLRRALDLRHQHFDAILSKFYDESEPPLRLRLAA